MSSTCTFSAFRRTYTFCKTRSTWILRGLGKYHFYSNDHGAGGTDPSAGNRGMNVFDRKAKRWHKNRAAMAPDADTFDYISDEVREGENIKKTHLDTSRGDDHYQMLICSNVSYFQIWHDLGCAILRTVHIYGCMMCVAHQCDV